MPPHFPLTPGMRACCRLGSEPQVVFEGDVKGGQGATPAIRMYGTSPLLEYLGFRGSLPSGALASVSVRCVSALHAAAHHITLSF